jgi:hypothetical protein
LKVSRPLLLRSPCLKVIGVWPFIASGTGVAFLLQWRYVKLPLQGLDPVAGRGSGALRRSERREGIGCNRMHGNEEPLRIPITDVSDLQTVEPREVAAVVEAYLDEAARLCLGTVRIIHGRGTGVQRRIVRAVLARTPFVSSYRDAPPEAGGWGATVVSLHRSS